MNTTVRVIAEQIFLATYLGGALCLVWGAVTFDIAGWQLSLLVGFLCGGAWAVCLWRRKVTLEFLRRREVR
jgi:hypothetical protein